MLKSSLTISLTRRSTTGTRSRRQSPGAWRPTNQVRFAETLLAQPTPDLVLAPPNEARIARTAQPSVDVLPTPPTWVAYPHAGLLTGLLSLLATEAEPDMLPAYLMREVAEQLGVDGAFLFRTNAATQTLVLASWAIVDGAIQHRDTLPALVPLTCAPTLEPPAAPQVERYTLRHDRHPYLRPTSMARFRQQGYQVGLTLPLLAGGQLLGFLECMARDDMAFLPSQIEQARALAELTARELDVLQQLAKGRSNEQIAAVLTMSEGTVKFHINHVLHKLGAADRTQAVLTALKRGFVYLD